MAGRAGSVDGPAAVDGQDDAGEVAGGGAGEQEGGAGDHGDLPGPGQRRPRDRGGGQLVVTGGA